MSESHIFYLPDVGEGLQEAEIIAWHVTVGDHVVADQPLVSIETDKAIVDVPSPQSGHIVKLLAQPGDHLQVGDALVEFEQGQHADSGTVVGDLVPAEQSASGVSLSPATIQKVDREHRAAPAVRALARQLGVDLSRVQPTGPDNSITSEDVRQTVQTSEQAALRGVRRAMAERMAQAHKEVVPATISDEADIDAWNQHDSNVMQRLIRAIAAACQAAPALNAWFDSKTLTRRLHQQIDLGIAVNTDEGLFVPVLRDIGRRDTADLQQGLARLKADVQARSIPPQELRGQTITLSNFGAIGGRFATMVVVPPQVAIVGAGRITRRIVAVEEQAVAHSILPLSLTFDHRAVSGGEAAQFLVAVITDLQLPE